MEFLNWVKFCESIFADLVSAFKLRLTVTEVIEVDGEIFK